MVTSTLVNLALESRLPEMMSWMAFSMSYQFIPGRAEQQDWKEGSMFYVYLLSRYLGTRTQ